MAVLPRLHPNGDGSTSSMTAPTGAATYWQAVDDYAGGGTHDSDTTYITAGLDVAGIQFLQLTDMPSNFASLDSLSIACIVKLQGTRNDDITQLYAQMYAADETTALSAEVLVTDHTTGGVYTVDSTTFTGLTNTTSKTLWDGARLRLRWSFSKNMASDGIALRVSAVYLDGTYTASVPKTEQGTAAFTASSVFTATGTVPVALAKLVTAKTTFNNADGLQLYPGLATISGGQLTLTPSTNYAYCNTVSAYDGLSSEAFVQVLELAQGGSSVETSFIVQDSTTPSNRVRILRSATGTTHFQCTGQTGSNTTTNTDMWWRISESGGTVTCWTGTNGISWTARQTFTTPAWFNSVRWNCMNGVFDATTPSGVSRYDNVSVAPIAGTDNYSTAVLNDAPVAYWRLAETTGTTATDLIGAHNGTYSGGVTLNQTGAIAGNASATFDGTDDRVIVPHHANLGGLNGYSAEAWVKPTDRAAPRQIVSKGQYNSSWRFRIEQTTGYLWAISPQDGGANDLRVSTGNVAVPLDGNWHHVVATYTPGTGTTNFYIDGAAAGSSTTANTGTVKQNTEDLKVGGMQDVVVGSIELFKGGLDEVAVYNYPLSLAQVQSHYAMATPATVTHQGLAAFTATSTFTAGAITPLNSFTDPFNTLNNWTTGNGTVSSSSGELVITPGTNVPDAYPYARTTGIFNATGQTLTVQNIERPTTGGGVETLFGLWDSAATLQWQDHARFLRDGGSNLVAQVRGQTPVTITDGASRPWWRIAESGGTLTFSTSVDGAAWTVGATFTTPAWYGSARVWAASGSWNATVPSGLARFDNLNLPPGSATVLRTGTFETALVNTTTGYDNTGESSANAINSRDTTLFYKGIASHKARHNGYTGSGGGTGIIRGNWYNPPGSTVHTDPVISRGTERWTGGAFYIRTGDTHVWTGLMRWSDYVSPEVVAKSLLEVTLENGNLTVNLTDYGGSSTGTADRYAIHSVALPRTNGWTYIELGSFVHEDNTIGWTELWVDGVQIGSRVTGRTLKLSSHNFRHIQFGMGTYGLGTNGYVNPAAEVNVDDTYLAEGRRGSSLTTVTHQGLASFTASSSLTSAAARAVPALAGMTASSVLTSVAVGGTLFKQDWEAVSLGTRTTEQDIGGMGFQLESGGTAQVWDNAAKSATWPTVPQGSRALALHSIDNGSGTNARSQVTLVSGFPTTGSEVFTRWRIGFPSDFPTDISTWFAVGQWFAAPWNGSPAVGWAVGSTSGVTYLRRVAPWGTVLWQTPIVAGGWLNIEHRVVFATSAGNGGLEEIWLNGVKQTWLALPGSGGQPANYTTTGESLSGDSKTAYIATVLNDATGSPVFYHQAYRGRPASPASVTLLFDDTKIAYTYADVAFPSATQQGDAALTASSILTSAAARTVPALAGMTASSVLTSAATRLVPALAGMTASSVLTSAATRTVPVLAGMTASSVLTSAATRAVPALASMSASSVFTAVAEGISTQLGAAALVASSTLTAAPNRLTSAAASFVASSVTTAGGMRVVPVQSAMTATSALLSGIVVARPGAAAYTATSVLTVSAARLVSAGVSLVSTSVLTAAGLVTKIIAAGLEATSTLTIGTQVIRPAAAVFTATSAFAAEVTQQGLQLGQASLVAASTLSSAGHVTRVSMSAMSSSSVIQSAGLRVVSGFVTMSAASSLSAAAMRLLQAAANLAASSVFVAGAERSVPAVAALSATSIWLAEAVREQFVESTFTSASVLAITAVRLTLGTAEFTAVSALMSDGTTEIFFQAEFSASSLFTAGTEPVRMVFVRSPITGQMVPAIVKVRNHWTQPWVEPTVKVRNPDLPSQWIEMS